MAFVEPTHMGDSSCLLSYGIRQHGCQARPSLRGEPRATKWTAGPVWAQDTAGAHWDPVIVPSKLPQFTRPPLLPQSPHCSLYPAPARLRPPLGLAHTIPSAWRAPP